MAKYAGSPTSVNSVNTEQRKRRRCFETATHFTFDFISSIFLLYSTDEPHSDSWVGPFIPHSCLTDCSSEKWQTEERSNETRRKSWNPDECRLAVSGGVSQGFYLHHRVLWRGSTAANWIKTKETHFHWEQCFSIQRILQVFMTFIAHNSFIHPAEVTFEFAAVQSVSLKLV